ncbi:MAG TPA: glycosyltransferase family 1 protein [Gammaproteobacteria bacterium]|nr:glycosyltransferase family 1 protein [Gammaproteobacteria bacterium]HRP86210.1 glycosyltransferase family 1 protein [Gammaproteobacteria bacterium]
MRIALVSDAWLPQTNGVVRTLRETTRCLEAGGHAVCTVTPTPFMTLPCPTYPEIRLAAWPWRRVRRILDDFRPDAVHIATEGPIGLAGRHWCRDRGLTFTTSFHTRFPEYVRLRAPIPEGWTWRVLRWFHDAAARTLVPTATQQSELAARGFRSPVVWGRGVDTELFHPRRRTGLPGPGPHLVYLGRVAVEKNIGAFLALDVPGTKWVIGGGPALESFREAWPGVNFLGARHGVELASLLASGDVFVFPSRTDTFGIVLLEAMACGMPVAAYPVPGPADVVRHGETGVLDEDLAVAVRGALELDRGACRRQALENTWERATEQFSAHLVPA